MTGYREMTSGGSFNEATRREDRATARLEAEARSTARIEKTVEWAKETFPDLNESWYPQLASAAMMVKRSGRPVNRENVIERVRASWGEEFCRENGLPEVTS